MPRYTIEPSTPNTVHNDEILVEFAQRHHMTLDIRYINGLHIRLGRFKFTSYNDALTYMKKYEQNIGR